MTMKELAKLANVSVSAVSKAFNEADDISESTKQHIFALAKEYGCYGKFYKGKYPKKIIAVICPELVSSYYTCFVDILRRLIEDAGHLCIVSADSFSSARQAELVDYFMSYLKVDGMIVFHLKSAPKKGQDKPIISLFANARGYVNSVNVDIREAIFNTLEIVMQYGHSKIAFLGEPLTRIKANCFQEAAEALNCQDVCIIESKERFEKAGEDGVRQLLETHPDTTAIICAYDNIAYGAIRQLKKAGLQVPQDVSVVGIDNISSSTHTKPALTSIDTQPEEVCRIAWELLQGKLQNNYRPRQNIMIKTRLVLRESLDQVRQSK